MVDKYMDTTKIANYWDGRVSAPVMIDCWLEEGAITVNAANTIQYGGSMLSMPSETYGAVLTIRDLVQLASADAAYTFDLLAGKPIVSKVSGSGGVVGEILTYPTRPVQTPASTGAADTLAKRVAGKFYRIGVIRLFGVQYCPVLCDAGTAIVVGDRLLYDVSDAKWKKDGGATSPVVACHNAASGSSIYVGALFLGGAAISQA
jgi:hypothetical protein